MNNQRRAADLQEYLEFMAAFSSAPIEDGSAPYAVQREFRRFSLSAMFVELLCGTVVAAVKI